MRTTRPQVGRNLGPKIVDLANHGQHQRLSGRQIMRDFAMAPGYHMPQSLAFHSPSSLSDAQFDAQDVTRRSIQSFARLVGQPEYIPMFMKAFDGLTARDRPIGAHTRLMQLVRALQPDEAASQPAVQAVVAKSVRPELLDQSGAAHALPEPIAMAYIEKSTSIDSIAYSQNLGFRDMQLQAQFVAPMNAIKVARDLAIDVDERATLPRLLGLFLGNHNVARTMPAAPVKVLSGGQLVAVPTTRHTIDPRLAL